MVHKSKSPESTGILVSPVLGRWETPTKAVLIARTRPHDRYRRPFCTNLMSVISHSLTHLLTDILKNRIGDTLWKPTFGRENLLKLWNCLHHHEVVGDPYHVAIARSAKRTFMQVWLLAIILSKNTSNWLPKTVQKYAQNGPNWISSCPNIPPKILLLTQNNSAVFWCFR